MTEVMRCRLRTAESPSRCKSMTQGLGSPSAQSGFWCAWRRCGQRQSVGRTTP